MTTHTRTLLFITPPYQHFSAALAASDHFEPGQVETRQFPDGERYQRIESEVFDRDVIVLGGTIDDGETLRIFDLACALVKYGARRLTLAVPYFGYSTMERAVRVGDVVTAKARARLLSAIPAASMGNRVVMLDLHAAGIPYYFEGHIQAHHLYAKGVIVEEARRLGGEDFVLACTDAGRAKWVESLANDLGVSAAFVFKRRLGDTQTEISGISADVAGRRVVIYDDMIRSGSSLRGAAEAYRRAGAVAVSAVATHGVFPGDALEQLRRSGALDVVVCTDSHPRVVALADGEFLRVATVAPLLAERLEALTPWI